MKMKRKGRRHRRGLFVTIEYRDGRGNEIQMEDIVLQMSVRLVLGNFCQLANNVYAVFLKLCKMSSAGDGDGDLK